ncbi:MAG: beta-galactosidase, partial [Anaerovorax sp.]
MYFGTDYYPEHWTKQRWGIDAKLMKEAGINLVRLGEFAWAKLEPIEGQWDFTWLDEAVDIFYKEGIKVVIGTPTATPPKWLVDKYPKICKEDENGLIQGFGSRRHYCYNSDVYSRYTEKIVNKMAQRYGGNPKIAAWQIDNEFTCGDGLYCYCEECREKFIAWLKNKYKSLDALNIAWGTVFWSQTYTDWKQIIVPKKAQASFKGNNGHNPGMNLDYSRFQSDAIVSYCAVQKETIKKWSNLPVTHNMVENLYDYYKLGKEIDFVSYDNYPSTQWQHLRKGRNYDPAFAIDLERGVKNQNIWIMEEQSGPCG